MSCDRTNARAPTCSSVSLRSPELGNHATHCGVILPSNAQTVLVVPLRPSGVPDRKVRLSQTRRQLDEQRYLSNLMSASPAYLW